MAFSQAKGQAGCCLHFASAARNGASLLDDSILCYSLLAIALRRQRQMLPIIFLYSIQDTECTSTVSKCLQCAHHTLDIGKKNSSVCKLVEI